MLPLTNKEKETRIVTFKEDYSSTAAKSEATKAGKDVKPQVIYRNGSVHAIHYSLVKKLEAKGVKMDVKKFDKEASEKRIKARMEKEKA
jgi:hypothetical protein